MTRWSYPVGEAAGTTATGDDTHAAAAASRAEAAVLVVDVSGFTALTARLESEHGKRAADRLAVVMDDLLGALADIVVAQGGTVIDIVGDSVQAMWIASDASDGTACALSAARAARAMIAYVEDSAALVREDAAKLPVRIGIGFGPLTLARVGGHEEHWDSLVWGPALLDAAQCTTLAPIGGTAVHERAWRLIGGAIAGERRGACWELKPEPPTRAAATTTPQPGADSATAWAAELRSASILFVRLFRIDEMPLAQIEQVQRRVLLVQEAAATHGGRLDKVHADEKGMAAVVVFGLPPMPVADAATRAVAAAIDLRTELRDLGIEASIGVATGKVRAGIGGAFAKAHHTIYGGAANLAARCMQACNDEILSDAATRAQAGDAFEFFAPEAHSLKGLGDGLAIFGVGNARQRIARTAISDATPIAGRKDDLAYLESFVAGRSSGRVLLLEGEVGIGKSRLASYAASFASEQGSAVLATRAGPLATRTPLFAWRDIAATMLRDRARAQNLRLGETQAALIEAAGENPALAPLTNPLFGQDLSDATANAVSDPAGRPRLARRLQAMILSQLMGETKRLIVIEDAHWLDEASTLLAADLHTMNPQMRLLLVGRNPHGRMGTTLTDAFGGDALAVHTVMPLGMAGTGELAAGVLGAFDPAHPLVDWLHGRTRGNPLFARELLRAMPQDVLREGLISPGAWRDAEAKLRQLDLPQTIEAAAAAQLGAQSLERLGLLKAASVVGGSFDRDILLALDVPVGHDSLESELAALVDEGLLVADDGNRWRFAQAVLSDAVYGSLPDRQRRELHRKAVAHLEGLPRNIARNFSAQIAHHWQEAGEPPRALKSLRRAGLAALNAGAYADAINFFEQAIDIVKQNPGAETRLGTLGLARLNLELCNAYFVVGDHHKAVGPGLASLDGMWPGAPKRSFGWATMALREAALLWVAIKFPSLYASERKSLRARARNRLRCDAATRLSDCYYFMEGSLPPSLALSLYGVRAAEHAGDLSVAGPPYGFIAYTAGMLRLDRISKFCTERTIAACRKKNNMFGLQRATGGALLLALSLGRWEEARPLIESTFEYRKRVRNDTTHGMALSVAGQFHRWLGEFPQAQLIYGELAALGREISDDQFVSWSHLNFGLLALFNGDPVTAEAEYNKGLLVLGRMIEVQALFISETMRALAILRQGRFDEVAAIAEGLIARAEQTPLQFSSGDAFGGLCEVMNGLLAQFGDGPEHRARALRARKRASQFAFIFPLGRPIVALHDGQLACLLGKPRRAGRIWRHGLKIAEAMPENYEAARLHAALATLPVLSDDVRSTHGARALELAVGCGVDGVPPLPIASPSQSRS